MRLPTLVALFSFAILGLVQLVSAVPIAPTHELVAKRGTAEVTRIFNDFEQALTGSINYIKHLEATGTANEKNLSNERQKVLEIAKLTASRLGPIVASDPESRQAARDFFLPFIKKLGSTPGQSDEKRHGGEDGSQVGGSGGGRSQGKRQLNVSLNALIDFLGALLRAVVDVLNQVL